MPCPAGELGTTLATSKAGFTVSEPTEVTLATGYVSRSRITVSRIAAHEWDQSGYEKPGESSKEWKQGEIQMTNKNAYEYRGSSCTGYARNAGQKLLLLMIGGGIGAAIALLLAPKKGSELRHEISDMTAKGIDQTAAAANQLKQRTAEIYKTAKETGSEVLEVVAEGASAVREEVSSDVKKIGAIVENSAKRAVSSAKPRTIA